MRVATIVLLCTLLVAFAAAADDEYYKALGLNRDANEAQVRDTPSWPSAISGDFFFHPSPS